MLAQVPLELWAVKTGILSRITVCSTLILSEEAAQGKGEHIIALSGMFGCQGEYQQSFESMMKGSYPHLFLDMQEIDSYERAHLLDYEINRLMELNQMGNKCTYISSS